jgi:hypothetical protein
MLESFADGLAAGTLALSAALGKQATVAALTDSVDSHEREQAMTNLLARRHFLQGMDVASAWTAAVQTAAELAAAPGRPAAMPALPNRPVTIPGRAKARRNFLAAHGRGLAPGP